MAARAAKAAATGQKPRGRLPVPPVEGPGPTDQVNLTDEESRIMPVPEGGFEQCYNAQACVAAGCLLVVATDVVQAANDKQQVEPMLGQLAALPAALGQVETLLADTGYCSEANVQACVAAGIGPLLAMGRQPHHPPLAARAANAARGDGASAANAGGQDTVRLRKHTPEPVFGIIKAALGFRQFPLRGLDKVRGEWNLVTMAYNLKRLFALAGAT